MAKKKNEITIRSSAAELYGINVRTINDHLKKIFADNELDESSVIRNFRITAFLQFNQRELLTDNGRVAAEVAKTFALTEFEKYRVVQDKLFESDFERFLELSEGEKHG